MKHREVDLDISSQEVADYIHNISKKLLEDPIMNIDSLSDIGIVLTSIGILRGYPSLKLLGDLFMDLPEKLRSLLSLKYSLVGTLGDVQAMVSKVVDDSLSVIVKVLGSLEKMFSSSRLETATVLDALGALYELATIKLPTITTISSIEEEEE